ncbi:unnamed protein product [Leuciscus chuanchicus]
MAEASILWDQFSCSICLDLLKDPVTIACGHSYCMSCITDCWNKDDQKRVYSCPQCRQTFTPRPVLNKNVMFAEMVETLKKTKVQTARPALSYAGPGDVECDVCTGRKYKAVKSCLVCLESYCQPHFERHEEFHSGSRRHKVTDATGRLQEMICSEHDRLMEVYCRTDQHCICLLCTMDKHTDHETVSAEAERSEKQKQLWDIQGKIQQRIQEGEEKLQELKETVKTHKSSAQAAVQDSERIFTELIRSIERRRSEVTRMIRDQEKDAVSRAEGLLKRLEQEIDDLRRREAELKHFLHTDDHIHFLQVLCRESVCGRCYWEVEWSGTAGVGISVSYKSISRKGDGDDCVFGFNDQSWRLSCSDSRCAFRHNQKVVKLPVISSSSRIGVYVDHRAGILSFYSVSDTMTLIHRIQTTFTQPLYPGFGVNLGSKVKLSSAEII